MAPNSILVYVTGAFETTSHVWLYTLPGAVTHAAVQECMSVFKHASVWNGIDKKELSATTLEYMSCALEVPKELAVGIAYSIGRFLQAKKEVSVYFCAQDPHAFEAESVRYLGLNKISSSQALSFIVGQVKDMAYRLEQEVLDQ